MEFSHTQKNDEMINAIDEVRHKEQYRQIASLWHLMCKTAPMPSYEQWKNSIFIIESSQKFLPEEIDQQAAFKAIEKLVTHLSLCNLAIVRRTVTNRSEGESLKLAALIRMHFNIDVKYNRRLIDLFDYYIRDSESVFNFEILGGKYVPQQRLKIALDHLLQEVEEKMQKGDISKEKGMGIIEGATTVMMDSGLCTKEMANTIMEMAREMYSSKKSGFGNTITKWATTIIGKEVA